MVESTTESSSEPMEEKKSNETWQFAESGRCLIDVDQETRDRILHCMKEAETLLKSKDDFVETNYVLLCPIHAVMMKQYGHELCGIETLKPQI